MHLGHALQDVAEKALDLLLPRVALGQTTGRLGEEAGFLLDQEDHAGRPDEGEIDLTDARIVAALVVRPVHAVIDVVVVIETGGEQGERLPFALGSAGGGEFVPAGGKYFSVRSRERACF